MNIDFEFDKVIEKIKIEHAKVVCLQLPDGLKPKAIDIQKEIEAKTDANVIIWMGNAFGACDIPYHLKDLGIDLLVQFGHSEWNA